MKNLYSIVYQTVFKMLKRLNAYKQRICETHGETSFYFRLCFFVVGLIALTWFLIRVIPKPSRAAYPCMQTAFPVASSFVVWLITGFGSIAAFRAVAKSFAARKYTQFLLFAVLGMLLFVKGHVMITSEWSFGAASKDFSVLAVKKAGSNMMDELPAKVAVVQSERAHAIDIDFEEITNMVREAVSLAGGLNDIVRDGMTVMLKPNLVNYFDYRPVELNGVTTDHRFIQVVVNLVRELNPNGKIILAEGSAERTPTLTNFSLLKYDAITGVDEFLGFEVASGGYQEFTSLLLVPVDLPDSLSLYPDEIKPNKSRTIYYNKAYYDADVLISLPVLKNHQTAGITGGVKNVAMGATPSNIYGNKNHNRPFLRSQVIDHANGNLDKWLHDYYIGRPADFVIIDGLQGVSNGPGGGGNLNALMRNQHNMRLVMAGKDAVATDAIAGLIIGHDPQKANHLVYLHNHGLGIVDPALIEVVGVPVHFIRTLFGFDHTNYTTPTAFYTFLSADYQVSGHINAGQLHLSVGNPADLARMQVAVDGQAVEKYIIGGFDELVLDINHLDVGQGLVEVWFEDRFLNPLKKQFMAAVTTDALLPEAQTADLMLYPNPVRTNLSVRIEGAQTGHYAFSVYDMTGKIIRTWQVDHNEAHLITQFNTDGLTAGRFILRVMKPDGKVQSASFLKQ